MRPLCFTSCVETSPAAFATRVALRLKRSVGGIWAHERLLMICPSCRESADTVLETRGGRRRRECGACGTRWTTEEKVVPSSIANTLPVACRDATRSVRQTLPVGVTDATRSVSGGVGGGLSTPRFNCKIGENTQIGVGSEPRSNPTLVVNPSRARARAVIAYPTSFEALWDGTGKHGGKFAAFKAWDKVGRPSWQDVEPYWVAYMASDHPARGFVKDLSTWLNGRCHEQTWEPTLKTAQAPQTQLARARAQEAIDREVRATDDRIEQWRRAEGRCVRCGAYLDGQPSCSQCRPDISPRSAVAQAIGALAEMKAVR